MALELNLISGASMLKSEHNLEAVFSMRPYNDLEATGTVFENENHLNRSGESAFQIPV